MVFRRARDELPILTPSPICAFVFIAGRCYGLERLQISSLTQPGDDRRDRRAAVHCIDRHAWDSGF